MCGIIFAVSHTQPLQLTDSVLANLRARGPDCLNIHSLSINADDNTTRYLTFASSVLNLRGASVQAQPLIDPLTGSVFCWNGEAWTYDQNLIRANDSQFVFRELLKALNDCGVTSEHAAVRSETIARTLTSIAGPYAFVYYDAPSTTVYYARDPLGRRSLIADISSAVTTQEEITSFETIISSFDITEEGSGQEVVTSGIHRIQLQSSNLRTELIPWPSSTLSINRNGEEPGILGPAKPTNKTIELLESQLLKSIGLRVADVPTYNHAGCTIINPSRIAVLFSGGVDCTLLARLCHESLPLQQPIDLLNVAFENPRTMRAAVLASGKAGQVIISPFELCPDRKTGLSSFNELRATCPGRLWRFVSINVPYKELLNHRSNIIRLMRPHNTEMDLSIAMALYFAARGDGVDRTHGSPPHQAYKTTARVLLSGLGADELFGGYSRHSAAFSRGGFNALNDELELDFTRIATRNLGRDDRVMAHWSREVRYPFLDENFVKFALELPAWEKVGFRKGERLVKQSEEDSHEVPESDQDLDPAKMVLRCLLCKLGMKKAANERKRAIQFGARTAKMDVGKTKGTDILSTM